VLSKNLNDALDYQRSKTQAVYIEVLDKDKQSYTTYVIFGIITVVYGLAIYYFLPLSMLSLNFKLILRIFFMILLGMLFGLTLLSFNLQRLLEIALTHTLLFFEQSSMRMLVLKNLTAHKLRNKMTSIIFSLAIGFIVFLIVSYNLQIKSSSLLNLKKQGTYLVLSTSTDNAISPTIFDPIIRRY
jgi:FtsH-binding integral membrane protein